MHEQRGSFNGIDTCNLTTLYDFSYRSKLQSEAESRSIINRGDINSLLTNLVQERKMSKIIASDKKRLADHKYGDYNFQPLLYGATYVPLEIAMAIQKESNNPYMTVIIDDKKDREGNPLPPVSIKNKIYWPPSLFPCQKMTKWGAIFPLIPKFKSKNTNTRTLWLVSSIIIGIQEEWNFVRDGQMKKSDWRGWLLVYLTKFCFTSSTKRQGNGDVFSFKYISTVDKMKEKFPDEASIFNILEEFEEIQCVNSNEHMDGMTF